MNDSIPDYNSPISKAIKSVGVGKRGSKSLSRELTENLAGDIKHKAVSEIQLGAFLGALVIKGLSEEENALKDLLPKDIFKDYSVLIDYISPNTPKPIKEFSLRLLGNETLKKEEAYILGQFLFSNEPSDGLRAMIASVLRVRYETQEEYGGILKSMDNVIIETFKSPLKSNKTIIQLAEPFDGVDHSNLITPLIAFQIQKLNYQTICLTGRNSGPKFGNNLFDLAKILRLPFVKNHDDLLKAEPVMGWYAHQADLSPAIDRWVGIRKQTIKRPFLATLERFINPFNAGIIIASAFHPSYGEKMIGICQNAGYPSAIIVRNGLEGTIAFPLMRSAKILCTAKKKDGSYAIEEFNFSANGDLNIHVKREEKLEFPSLDKNAALINAFVNDGKTGYPLFDYRIKATCLGLTKAIEWIENNYNQ